MSYDEDYSEDPYDDADEDDVEEEFEYVASFEGPCTCPEDCSNYDETGAHGWGDCGGTLSDDSDCPCEAGWCE